MTLVRKGAFALAMSLFAVSVQADEIRLFGAGAVQHATQEIIAAFEKATGHKVVATFGTAGAIGKRLEAGEAADVVLSSSAGLAAAKARLAPDAPQIVGRVRMGMAAKAGAPKPDISTLEKLKAALLAAPSIAYGDPARGATTGVHFAKIVAQLGLDEQVKSKAVLRDDGFAVSKAVAEGAAAIGFTQTTEIQAVKGAEVAGLLPDDVQLVSSYAAALTIEGARKEPARALFAKITGAAGRAEFEHHGFDVKK